MLASQNGLCKLVQANATQVEPKSGKATEVLRWLGHDAWPEF
jgi:hypothetical protein